MDQGLISEFRRLPAERRRRVQRAIRRGRPLEDPHESTLAARLASEMKLELARPLLSRVVQIRWLLVALLVMNVLLGASSPHLSLLGGLFRGLLVAALLLVFGQVVVALLRVTLGRNLDRARAVNLSAPEGVEESTRHDR